MAKWRISLLKQLGSFVEVITKLTRIINDLVGDTKPMDRLIKDPALLDDVAQLVIGRSIALSISKLEVNRGSDSRAFTCLLAGEYIVAVTHGFSREKENTRRWLRIGDHVKTPETDGTIEMEVVRIECLPSDREVRLYGIDVNRGGTPHCKCTYDEATLCENHPHRQLLTQSNRTPARYC